MAKKHELVYVLYIATTAEKLWDALTQGEFTKAYWWQRRIESEWTKGAAVKFYDGDSGTVTDNGEVLAAERPTELCYTFRNGPDAETAGETSRVTFIIEPQEGQVKLTLVHDQMSSEEDVIGWREGWAPILSSLKTYLETGKPLPQERQPQVAEG